MCNQKFPSQKVTSTLNISDPITSSLFISDILQQLEPFSCVNLFSFPSVSSWVCAVIPLLRMLSSQFLDLGSYYLLFSCLSVLFIQQSDHVVPLWLPCKQASTRTLLSWNKGFIKSSFYSTSSVNSSCSTLKNNICLDKRAYIVLSEFRTGRLKYLLAEFSSWSISMSQGLCSTTGSHHPFPSTLSATHLPTSRQLSVIFLHLVMLKQRVAEAIALQGKLSFH